MTSVGFIALARPTFDVPYAEEVSLAALETLRGLYPAAVGNAALAMDTEAVSEAMSFERLLDSDVVVVLQATFADSTLVKAAADQTNARLVLWAVPEPEVGGRLRLNSFCGINLASYLLKREDRAYTWLHRAPGDPAVIADLAGAITGEPRAVAPNVSPTPSAQPVTISGSKIGVIGDRPDGFEPCDYDDTFLDSLGIAVDRIELDDWFTAASATTADQMTGIEEEARSQLAGFQDLTGAGMTKSLQLAAGLEALASERHWAGVATRCWPECFTEHGGAACYGNSRMSSLGVPGCCEADVYGNVTALLLAQLSDLPPFVADLVGLDYEADTATFWHCGMAPKELAAESSTAMAAVHSNRLEPLLNEFPLRPGRVTLCRLSQSSNQTRLVVGGAEMLDSDAPFTGTCGVAKLDGTAASLRDTILGNGLEHHYGIAYGDHQEALYHYAASVGLEVIEL